MGYHFSKSKYCRFWQCPKMSWHSASSPKSRSARSDPNDPEPDYHNPDGIHNGAEAMNIFPKLKDMPPEEADIVRKNLLAYCKPDTYAMVKVWEKLCAVAT